MRIPVQLIYIYIYIYVNNILLLLYSFDILIAYCDTRRVTSIYGSFNMYELRKHQIFSEYI